MSILILKIFTGGIGMEIFAEVLKDISTDTYFKVKFTYTDKNMGISKGIAEITRQYPKPVIKYDIETEGKLVFVDRCKLELELMNTVMSYIFAKGVARTWRGDIIMNTV